VSQLPYFGIDSFIHSKEFFSYPESSLQLHEAVSENKLDNEKNIDDNDSSLDYMITFSEQSLDFCVGLVDIVDSTKITADMTIENSTRLYQIFLNSMSKLVTRFGGSVIKNIGDSLLYYFPESTKPKRKFGFMSCLECNLAMIEAHDIICRQLKLEGLSTIDYRISSDYGSVAIMNSNESSLDFFGPPINMCTKINRVAIKNRIVIGGDLYQIVKNFDDYSYKPTQAYSLGFKYSYPVYFVTRKD